MSSRGKTERQQDVNVLATPLVAAQVCVSALEMLEWTHTHTCFRSETKEVASISQDCF